MYCKITKLSKLKNPAVEHNPFEIYSGETFKGECDEPEVGKELFVQCRGFQFLKTSTVKSIYKMDSDQDKLVLPSDFPDAVELDFSGLKFQSGDMLIATRNSIYAIWNIQEN